MPYSFYFSKVIFKKSFYEILNKYIIYILIIIFVNCFSFLWSENLENNQEIWLNPIEKSLNINFKSDSFINIGKDKDISKSSLNHEYGFNFFFKQNNLEAKLTFSYLPTLKRLYYYNYFENQLLKRISSTYKIKEINNEQNNNNTVNNSNQDYQFALKEAYLKLNLNPFLDILFFSWDFQSGKNHYRNYFLAPNYIYQGFVLTWKNFEDYYFTVSAGINEKNYGLKAEMLFFYSIMPIKFEIGTILNTKHYRKILASQIFEIENNEENSISIIDSISNSLANSTNKNIEYKDTLVDFMKFSIEFSPWKKYLNIAMLYVLKGGSKTYNAEFTETKNKHQIEIISNPILLLSMFGETSKFGNSQFALKYGMEISNDTPNKQIIINPELKENFLVYLSPIFYFNDYLSLENDFAFGFVGENSSIYFKSESSEFNEQKYGKNNSNRLLILNELIKEDLKNNNSLVIFTGKSGFLQDKSSYSLFSFNSALVYNTSVGEVKIYYKSKQILNQDKLFNSFGENLSDIDNDENIHQIGLNFNFKASLF